MGSPDRQGETKEDDEQRELAGSNRQEQEYPCSQRNPEDRYQRTPGDSCEQEPDGIRWLNDLPEVVTGFDIKNIEIVLKALGSPQDNLRCIHVAGTNGKGSVCAMVASALQDAGYRTGLYTSPHMDLINERIRVDSRMISDQDLDRIIRLIRAASVKEHVQLTFFEYLTSAAFIYFAEQETDYAVFETGMGGRLDATNVITPIVSVITSIALDHTDQLGRTIEEIAAEKAGIIKKGSVLVTANEDGALRVIKEQCNKVGCRMVLPDKQSPAYELSLKGSFQQENAALAETALLQLGIKGLDSNLIRASFKKVFWPGRFEYIRDNIIIDGAHNPSALDRLLKDILCLSYRRLIVVFGVMKDKDIAAMAGRLEKASDMMILTSPCVQRDGRMRAASTTHLSSFFSGSVEEIADVQEAVRHALSVACRDDLIVVTGSLFTVAEARRFFKKSMYTRAKP